jgi:hypothetical protein
MWRRGILEEERCGCGEAFPHCPFWRKVGEAGFGGWDKLDLRRFSQLRGSVDRTRYIPQLAIPLARPGFQRALDEYVGYYVRAYTAIAEVSGNPVVVDSSKYASLAFCLHRATRLDLRVVHLLRDSRAVAYSWTKHVNRPEAAPGKYMMTYSPAASAVLWDTQNAAFGLLARAGVPTLRVRYEDLVMDTENVLQRIASFAGIPTSEPKLGFLGSDGVNRWADLTASHTASGNPMRFSAGRIEIRTDDTWRARFPARSRFLVSALTVPGLARYRYLRPRWGQAPED